MAFPDPEEWQWPKVKRTPQIFLAGRSILPRRGKPFREIGTGVVTPPNFPLVPQRGMIFLKRYVVDGLATSNRPMISANIFWEVLYEILGHQTLCRL